MSRSSSKTDSKFSRMTSGSPNIFESLFSNLKTRSWRCMSASLAQVQNKKYLFVLDHGQPRMRIHGFHTIVGIWTAGT